MWSSDQWLFGGPVMEGLYPPCTDLAQHHSHWMPYPQGQQILDGGAA